MVVRVCIASALGLAVLAGCGGGGGSSNNPAVTIAKSTAPNGDAQTDTVAAELSESLRVVVSENGAAKAGATVNWSSAAAGAAVSPTSGVTDANGLAATHWTLGTVAGAQIAKATLVGAGGSPVTFTATANPGNPSTITKVAGDSQAQLVSVAFGAALQVRVTDQFNNPISGVTVNWTATGSVTPASTSSNTNTQGVASLTVTAGATSGDATVQAAVSGIAGSKTFNLKVAAVKVTTGNFFFKSLHNNTTNPAVDTIAVNGVVLWVNGAGGHTVESVLTPSFPNSGPGLLSTYAVTFGAAGTYQYQCGIHGSVMTGRVVVQ
jgi:adhesin/invasin